MYEYTGLLRGLWVAPYVTWPNHKWAIEGRQARQEGPSVRAQMAVGMLGYLVAIFKLNTGQYDELLASYRSLFQVNL